MSFSIAIQCWEIILILLPFLRLQRLKILSSLNLFILSTNMRNFALWIAEREAPTLSKSLSIVLEIEKSCFFASKNFSNYYKNHILSFLTSVFWALKSQIYSSLRLSSYMISFQTSSEFSLQYFTFPFFTLFLTSLFLTSFLPQTFSKYPFSFTHEKMRYLTWLGVIFSMTFFNKYAIVSFLIFPFDPCLI